MRSPEQLEQLYNEGRCSLSEVIKITQYETLETILKFAIDLNDGHEWPISRLIRAEMKKIDYEP